MKHQFLLLLALLTFGGKGWGEPLEFTPQRIEQIIQTEKLPRHGACFAVSQGALNCASYLWAESDTRHVFFFLRDGKSYGEFRVESLSDGRFLSIVENYLVGDARTLSQEKIGTEHPCVRREETMEWKDGTWIGSKIRWSFLWCSANGEVKRREPAVVENMTRTILQLEVPASLMPKNLQYYVNLYRTKTTAFERAFYVLQEGKPYFLDHALALDRATPLIGVQSLKRGPVLREAVDTIVPLRALWIDSHPELCIEFYERIPAPPLDALPSVVRLKLLDVMKINASLLKGDKLRFEPMPGEAGVTNDTNRGGF